MIPRARRSTWARVSFESHKKIAIVLVLFRCTSEKCIQSFAINFQTIYDQTKCSISTQKIRLQRSKERSRAFARITSSMPFAAMHKLSVFYSFSFSLSFSFFFSFKRTKCQESLYLHSHHCYQRTSEWKLHEWENRQQTNVSFIFWYVHLLSTFALSQFVWRAISL